MQAAQWAVLVAVAVTVPSGPAGGAGPLGITCDVDRRDFRLLARRRSQVTFRLWTEEIGGVQLEADFVRSMEELTVLKVGTDRFESPGLARLQRDSSGP